MNKKVTLTGAHDGLNNAAVLTDSGESLTVDGLIGLYVDNTTDGSAALITDNDGTTITGTLAGGTQNDWDVDDVWEVVYWGYQSLLSKIYVPSAKAHMALQVALEGGYIKMATNAKVFTFTSRYDRANCAEPCFG